MHAKSPRYYPPKAPVWQGLLFLSLLCALFYAALNYYAGNALNSIGDLQSLPVAGQHLGAAALQRLMVLRLLFSLLFCLLLGFVGQRATGTLWAGGLVHTGAVLVMLWQDVPHEVLRDNGLLALALATGVGLLTLMASAWARWRAQRPKTLGKRR